MKTILTILLAATTLPLLATTTVPEPETIFYGKILNHSGPQPYQMTAGSLQWTISRTESEALAFSAQLRPLAKGAYSYRLAIPHSALALDLEENPDAIPLTGYATSHQHLAITVNGKPATIVTTGEATFDVSQTTRAATYRLDLLVDFPLPDTDGDGMADWWEDLHGLDKQLDDSAADLDGDGLANLAEFLAGSDPTLDSRLPRLLTHTVVVAGKGTSGILLQAMDTDTPPSGLRYTLTALPTAGTLRLRDARKNPIDSDQELALGQTFTQEDLNRGRLIFTPEANAENTTFTVQVDDGNPEHQAATGEVAIEVYRPDHPLLANGTPSERVALALGAASLPGVEPDDDQRLRQFLLAADGGYHSWDLRTLQTAVHLSAVSSGANPIDYLSDHGPAVPAAITGGSAADTLSGGLAADRLLGGPGDDILTGGQGRDRFVFASPADGSDTITDFSLADGDLLDFSRVLQGDSALLSDYVQLSSEGSSLKVGLDLDGNRSSFTDLTITLEGAAGPDLYTLWSGGHLLTDGLALPPRVQISASSQPASENGPTPATFTISLGSPATTPLEVGLLVTGAATNGVDYQQLPASVTVPAGATVVTLPLTPYEDALTEPAETVQLTLKAGDGYELGSSHSAQTTILDLLPELRLTSLVSTAVRDSNTPGVFLLERSGMIDRSILVRLEFDGTAAMGTDYESIAPFINLAAGETTALITVSPKPGAPWQFGAESVRLAITEHASYRTTAPSHAEILLVESQTRLTDWRATHFPELAHLSAEEFARHDPGATGVPILLRYAFDLHPRTPRRSKLPAVRLIDGHLAIQFTRSPQASDLRWIVEASSDLQSWQALPGTIENVSGLLGSDDPRQTLYRLTAPATAHATQFLRVRIDHQP